MFLQNSMIKLRAVEPEDLDILYKWENNTDLWIHGNTLAPYSKLALRQYVNDTQLLDIYQAKQLRLMICLAEDNTVIGTVDLYDFDAHNKRAGIGILIDGAYRKNRYASQTLCLMRQYAFNFLHLHQLYAYVSVTNVASLNLFGASAYQSAGILKNWIQVDNSFEDVHIMQLINQEEK